MTEEQWKSVWKLYESCKSMPREQLAAFLNIAAEDREIRDEVLAMLDKTPDAAAEAAGQRIGRYVVTARLGQGGMGEVLAARDPELDRTVAVKLLNAAAPETASVADRFIREAKAASALNHPNIVTIYEIVHTGPKLAIVMELVDGMPLRDLCGSPLPMDRVLHIGEQIARALSAAHARGIVHCDIKPENLMMRQDGLVKVLDFGLAQDLSANTSASVLPAGTLRYMSPEQSRGERASAAGDIFSTGIVLYELATGVHPFESGSIFGLLKTLNETAPRPPSSRNAFVPPQFDALILRMLAKDPAARPTAAEVARVLESRFRNPTIELSPLPDVKPVPESAGHRRWWIAAAAVLAIAAGAILWNRSGGSDIAFEPLPLTTLAGSEEAPSFSPDGSQVAFRGNQHKSWDVYVKLIGGGPPLRLTSDTGTHWYPAWSPDGNWIAFTARHDDGRNGVFLMPALGGPERLLAE
ncbi:MAG TPA: protein kinase, partial [Candidatus Solibacter sp.]|nr:protein kinase [Candidatus Solibacter sp.]